MWSHVRWNHDDDDFWPIVNVDDSRSRCPIFVCFVWTDESREG